MFDVLMVVTQLDKLRVWCLPLITVSTSLRSVSKYMLPRFKYTAYACTVQLSAVFKQWRRTHDGYAVTRTLPGCRLFSSAAPTSSDNSTADVVPSADITAPLTRELQMLHDWHDWQLRDWSRSFRDEYYALEWTENTSAVMSLKSLYNS